MPRDLGNPRLYITPKADAAGGGGEKHWTWPEDAVRPFESLWILVQRFLWLNVIGADRLRSEIGLSAWRRTDLITSNLPEHKQNLREARDRLIGLLGLTKRQTRHAMVRDSLTVESYYLRYCPQCLAQAYHSAIFQLRELSCCPIHGCNFLKRCANCGAPLPLCINNYRLGYAFSCPECQQLLTTIDMLIRPPSVGDLSPIRKTWGGIAELPRVEWMRGSGDEAALVRLTSRMFGGRLRSRDDVNIRLHVRRPDGSEFLHPEERLYLMTGREERSARIYKSYRRHLEKCVPGARKFATKLINRLDDTLTELVWSPLPPGFSPEARAFGLLRYVVECRGFEGIRSIHGRRSTWTNPATQRRSLPNAAVIPKPTWPGDFHCTEADCQWMEDHFLGQALLCIFADCLQEELRAKPEGEVDLRIFQTADQCDAAALAYFNSEGELEFWSGQFPSNKPKAFSMDDIK